jgi:hypothetical protein
MIKIEGKDRRIPVKQLGLTDDLEFDACSTYCSISVVSSVNFETGMHGRGSLDCRDSRHRSASSKMSLGVECLTDYPSNNMLSLLQADRVHSNRVWKSCIYVHDICNLQTSLQLIFLGINGRQSQTPAGFDCTNPGGITFAS